LREQAVSGTEVDDAPTAKAPTDPPRHFPGLEQLLARQASGVTHGAGDTVKQGVAGKTIDVPIREAAAGGGLKHESESTPPAGIN
jgi:hypothetical protein